MGVFEIAVKDRYEEPIAEKNSVVVDLLHPVVAKIKRDLDHWRRDRLWDGLNRGRLILKKRLNRDHFG